MQLYIYKEIHGSCICIIYFPGVEYLCAEGVSLSHDDNEIVKIHIRDPQTKKQLSSLSLQDLKFPKSRSPNTWSFSLPREIWLGPTNEETVQVMLWEQRELRNPTIRFFHFNTSMIQSVKLIFIHRYSLKFISVDNKKIISFAQPLGFHTLLGSSFSIFSRKA